LTLAGDDDVGGVELGRGGGVGAADTREREDGRRQPSPVGAKEEEVGAGLAVAGVELGRAEDVSSEASQGATKVSSPPWP